ncbi:HDOD domain-containing protein [Allohahella marinimesophila]|uniref:HDOD domain-containing protein n=1 Tax=Allohahella marinimesophila TaxID=1054972 RepID=A0ABP7PJD5_9GAMM
MRIGHMTIEMNAEQIEKVLQGIKIPPQPQILVDIQMEQIMPNPDITQIARLIRRDVGLAGTILKVVNSPFYGIKSHITSIEQAVALLGLTSVVNIVNGISIKGSMSDAQITELTKFWDTTSDVASIAASIARKVGYHSPDEAYLLGLFHNCGIPLMMLRYPNYKDLQIRAYADPHKRITEWENEQIQTNHAVVGYYTGRAWNLPAELCQIIAEHHRVDAEYFTEESGPHQRKALTAILKTAEHLAGNHLKLGNQTEDHEWDRIHEAVLELLGLSSYDLDEMTDSLGDSGLI